MEIIFNFIKCRLFLSILFVMAAISTSPACYLKENAPSTGQQNSAAEGKQVVESGTKGDITIGAASSLGDVLKLIGEDYSREHPGTRIYLSLGASSAIARQIIEGAPVDLFFPADEVQMDLLERAGLIAENTRVDLLGNQMVFIAAEHYPVSGSTPEEILGKRNTVIALCDPAVPIGNYARQYLEKKGIYESVKAGSVTVDNVRAVLAAVESGNADLGIVYRTDARAARSSRIVYSVPKEEGPKIVYPAAVTKNTRNKTQSDGILRYLQSPQAAQRFEQAGFLIIK